MNPPEAPQRYAAAFTSGCLDDLRWWVETDRKTALRLLTLIEAVCRAPFEGIGKPEALRHLGPGVWSRRLTQEHRLVYRVDGARVDFMLARYHY